MRDAKSSLFYQRRCTSRRYSESFRKTKAMRCNLTINSKLCAIMLVRILMIWRLWAVAVSRLCLLGRGTLRRGLSTNSSGPAQNASQKLSGVMATRRLLCSCTIARAAAMHTLLPKLQPQSRNVHFNRTVVAASYISAAKREDFISSDCNQFKCFHCNQAIAAPPRPQTATNSSGVTPPARCGNSETLTPDHSSRSFETLRNEPLTPKTQLDRGVDHNVDELCQECNASQEHRKRHLQNQVYICINIYNAEYSSS